MRPAENVRQVMKLLLDQFPIIAFFVAYFLPAHLVQAVLGMVATPEQAQQVVQYLFSSDRSHSIYLATAVAIPASLVQILVHRHAFKRFDNGQLATLALLVVLGGATLLLHDKRYIMWKPTAVYWLFAIVFLGSQYIGEKPIAERMMGHVMSAPRRIWNHVNASWVVFFAVLGVVNLYVARNFSETTWVKFKLFGVTGLLLVFAIAQTLYLSRHGEMKSEEKN
jgi:intracellular septation protein